MAQFRQAVEFLIKEEGGFGLCDNDRGCVNFGITQQTAVELGIVVQSESEGYIRSMKRTEAERVYRLYWWEQYHIDLCNSQGIGSALLQFTVQMNVGQATKLLQRSLNDMGEKLLVDGVLGRKTYAAINRKNPASLGRVWRGRVKNFYRLLALKNFSMFGDKLKGWLARTDRIFDFAKEG